jgi:hypothetical protein
MPRNRKIRYFYDFEFLEDGVTIEPISVGIRCEDGREYYAVFLDAPWARIEKNQWLVDNVVPYLPTLPDGNWAWHGQYFTPLDITSPDVKVKAQIRQEIYEFFLADDGGESRNYRSLWAWFSAYDHVALVQLWGKMVGALPSGVPMYTNDIKSLHERLGYPPKPNQQMCEHHALYDARHDEELFRHFDAIEARCLSEASRMVACCPMDVETAQEVLEVMRGE